MENISDFGFMRVAAGVPAVNVADCTANAQSIIDLARQADSRGVRLLVLPEMSVTAYTCGDLFHNATLLRAAEEALVRIAESTAALSLTLVAGAPLRVGVSLFNCAVVIAGGKIAGIVPKTYLPSYNEFYEKRWFAPSTASDVTKTSVGHLDDIPFGANLAFELDGVRFGIEICEDLWAPIPPSSLLALSGVDVILNLSASDDLIGKYSYLCSLIAQQSARCMAAYVYSGAGYGESSTDLVFDGKGIVAENGVILTRSDRWTGATSLTVADIDIEALRRDRMHSTTFADCAYNNRSHASDITEIPIILPPQTAKGLMRDVNPRPFVPASDDRIAERCSEIINIQTAGLARRLQATSTSRLVVGISGGLDSTLALLVAVRTFDRLSLDRKGIIGVTMPGFGTTGRTYRNAMTLMKSLGVTIREIPIAEAVNLHFRDIGHDPSITDVTYENSQARERTQILMDIANQVGGMVLGTGDLSELALGWATYNGDHMSMYGVNAGVPKTLVRYLVKHFADEATISDERTSLLDIVDTPISPELTPATSDGQIAQKTEDLVGPYELHDFFLYYMLRYGFEPRKVLYLASKAFPGREREELVKWLRNFYRRFFNQQFKRSCLPDGPKVGSVCLSPRGDWRMPSDASSSLWLSQIETL